MFKTAVSRFKLYIYKAYYNLYLHIKCNAICMYECSQSYIQALACLDEINFFKILVTYLFIFFLMLM